MADLPRISLAALAALSRAAGPALGHDPPELSFLRAAEAKLTLGEVRALAEPQPGDAAQGPLERISVALGLTPVETLTLGLLYAVEADPMAGRAVAYLQAPLGGSRPTVALAARAFGGLQEAPGSPLSALVIGAALNTGLFRLLLEDAPLPERALALPLHLFLALSDRDSSYPTELSAASADAPLPLPPSSQGEAERLARALEAEPRSSLLVRASSPQERRAAARAVAAALGVRALFLEGDTTSGLCPLLVLRNLLPVFCFDLGPGERKSVPLIPGYLGPVLALTGPDGTVDTPGSSPLRFSIRIPGEDERRDLWGLALGPGAAELATGLAADFCHSAARIAELGRLARQIAVIEGRSTLTRHDITAAARTLESRGLGGLAEQHTEDIPEEALIVAGTTQTDLEALLARCKGRDRLAPGLGVSAKARYRFGVRALFVGPSGTGKTLAAGWLATKLGLPLFRVDLAAVTSKYIGETEKNLAQILAYAEHAEIILLFDEADSLFARRTDVRDANDRFANAQTNYLLQRLESFDGITLLTSNSRARFDDAFARRLDVIVDFPHPTPIERRKLWIAHTGASIDERIINQLATSLDLAGGHVRNIVLAAQVLARSERRALRPSDLLPGIDAELRKLGKIMPTELRRELAAKQGPTP